ncbi:B3/4 domain-containing protein [Inquilinus sp. Marseille-Q2685]|uniref:B3/B4 domain-containing protein n=1 Tax=Inquilinus sp. Marseille-Q2685 TaxID=2866581 RepID=UPI001CE49B0D|nr:phenylalanine--tRNA ligase beta subunit-related protein [Inquilinus sp. Marseille-Q2685]
MLSALPVVDPAIRALRPDFVALSLVARGARNGPSDAESAARLAEACQAAADGPDWAAAHLEAWRDAYRGFGAKPQRTPCSAEALRKRAQRDGGLPPINRMVDLYNALSVRWAVPIGGEDLAAYAGPPRLVRATGDEAFETLSNGEPAVEHPEPGEVVWRDDRGVTCRRWNWRQGPRTRLDLPTTEMWFVIERLEPMPIAALEAVGRDLADGIRAIAPDARIETTLLGP